MPRVLIVEDDPDDRAFLEKAIEDSSEFELAASTETCDEAINALYAIRVDTVILDLVLPDGSGKTVLKHTRILDIPTLVMTVMGDERSAAEAIANGAAGYMLKESDARTIRDSISQMLCGEAPLNPRIARYLLDRVVVADAEPEEAPDLTSAQRRVLELIAHGYTDKECAAALHRSTHTIATHIKNIYRKLGVHSRGQAVSRAVAGRLIDPARLRNEQRDKSGKQ